MTLRPSFVSVVLAVLCAMGGTGCSGSDVDLGGGKGPGDPGPVDPATYPRLVVATKEGVRIWDKATSIMSNVPSTARLDAPGSAQGLGLDGDTLVVASGTYDQKENSALHKFAGAHKLANGAKPTQSIPGSVFTGEFRGGSFDDMLIDIQADSRHNLWIRSGIDSGSVHVLPANTTSPSAQFRSLIFYSVYDEGGDKLITSDLEMARFPVWNGAAAKTGVVPQYDYELTKMMVPGNLVLKGGRLYTHRAATKVDAPDVAIWNNVSSTSASREPDVRLHGVCGATDQAVYNRRVDVTNDVLIVVQSLYDRLQKESTRICLYKGASAISAHRSADVVITDPSIAYGGNPQRAWLTKDGFLFVVDKSGIVIFKNATTSPSFVTKLAMETTPNDFLILE